MTAARKLATCPPWPRRAFDGAPDEPRGAPALSVEFECATRNEANGSTNRWVNIHRRKAAHGKTEAALTEALVSQPLPAEGPWCVRLTRISSGKGLDDDATPLALKSVRDCIALALGVDDADPAVAFVYRAEKRKGPMSVRVEVWGPSALAGWLSDVMEGA